MDKAHIYQARNGRIYLCLQSTGRATALSQRQICELGLLVTDLDDFDWYAFLKAYLNEWPNPWMQVSVWDGGPPPESLPPANLDLRLAGNPGYFLGVNRALIYHTGQHGHPVVVLIRQGDHPRPCDTEALISGITNQVLPGIVLDPKDATWVEHCQEMGTWAFLTGATWDCYKGSWWATGTRWRSLPDGVEDVRSMLERGGNR